MLLQQHVRLTRGFREGCKGQAGAATPAGPPCALAALSVGRSALQTQPFGYEQTFLQRVGSQGLRGVSRLLGSPAQRRRCTPLIGVQHQLQLVKPRRMT